MVDNEQRPQSRREEYLIPEGLAEKPDNRASWNAIADVYQTRVRGDWTVLGWGVWCPDESELQVLGDISGKRALVVGCGGGEDIVALHAMGAVDLAGIDLSDGELKHAERHLGERRRRPPRPGDCGKTSPPSATPLSTS